MKTINPGFLTRAAAAAAAHANFTLAEVLGNTKVNAVWKRGNDYDFT